ncbi:MAG TPA: hypothetical protein VF245_08220 [Solirubrobacterales bacterium]
MSRARADRARGLLGFTSLVAVLVAVVLLVRPVGAGAVSEGLIAQPVFGAPAARFLGASPGEAPGEAWALAKGAAKIVRYTDAGGWETMPGPFGPGGEPIEALQFASGTLAGRTTPAGGVAVAAHRVLGEQMAIVRDPGGNPRQASGSGAALEEGETLFSEEGPNGVLLVPVEEPGGSTGFFDVPAVESGGPRAVLHFDGGSWSREPICAGFEPGSTCTPPSSHVKVLAIDATGLESAWLLAKQPEEGLGLFQREAGGGPGGETVWRQRQLGPPGSLGSVFAQEAPEFSGPEPFTAKVAARAAGQPLTVTPDGVWVDASLTVGGEAHDATVYYDVAEGKLTGSWCDLISAPELCKFELGAELPSGGGRSFAWPPDGGDGDPFGRRLVTGLGQGAVLDLEGSAFQRLALAGGSAGAAEGAALEETGEGWLGANPPVLLTRNPESSRLVSWPVPFRRPLTAIAPQPGSPIGDLGSEALAVGVEGEVARYLPGQGWVAEPLLTGSGARAKPTLRGVAWPEPGRAYAVGDGAAMWLWQKATGLWEPDPAAPPNLVRANFTAIAFDPNDASRGYAVGKQGLLLAYGRQWTQEALPEGVPAEANFTSVTFAGNQAIAIYKMPVDKSGSPVYRGGVLVNDGSGWRVDQGAAEALGGAVPQRVAGLPDGGAAIASEESRAGSGAIVIERQDAGGPWQVAPGSLSGYPAALAAIREGGQVRAIVAASPGQGVEDMNTDADQVYAQPAPGSPPLLTSPYPLPISGYVVRQTATGWRDEQHESYPLPARVEGQDLYDLPRRPDPMLALLIGPGGGQGWAVGGETGTGVQFQGSSIQTAGVMRYGPDAAPPENVSSAPVSSESGVATFAVGGNAQCAGPCADLAGTGIGPDVWLRAAVGRAAGIAPQPRAFLYTGPGVADESSTRLGQLGFGREEAAYASRLRAAAGSMPTFAAPSGPDLDRNGSLGAFETAFSKAAYYSFDSAGAGGTVRVIVLDYSAPTLGDAQSCWLAGELGQAGQDGVPAIVVGNRDVARQAPNAAGDAAQTVSILVNGTPPPGCSPGVPASGASAYFFDFPEQDRAYRLVSGARSIPAYGSGTLGYLAPQRPQETDYVGASGFLLASVDVAERDPATNVAPVTTRLIPTIGALALDATDGTLLRRSQPALFRALARRPLAGPECSGNSAPRFCEAVRPDPYVPIPSQCSGTRCSSAVFPEYAFTSSNPDIADFVAADPGSPNPRTVLLRDGKPVLASTSGLLCAFNAGTTTVTIATGGLSYSTKVTVLAGSVQRPCGTTPLRNKQVKDEAPVSPPPIAENPGFQPGQSPLPPPPAPSSPTPAPAPIVHHVPPSPVPPLAIAPFVTPTLAPPPVVPIVPPPPVPAAQPTPPSGTSPVSEREEEVAYDLVHHAVAARPFQAPATAFAAPGQSSGGGGPSPLPVALAALAALAAAGAIRGGRSRRHSELAYEATTHRRYR